MNQSHQTHQQQPANSINPAIWVKQAISFKYISNFAIIVGVLAFYMNAMPIFFVMAPLIIANAIVVTLVMICEFEAFSIGILGHYITDDVQRRTYNFELAVLSIVWHFVGIVWLYSVMRGGISQVYNPNFMGVFLWCMVLALFYFMIAVKKRVYGEINYMAYMFVYIVVLLVVSVKLYKYF
jgi:hypothetical protein